MEIARKRPLKTFRVKVAYGNYQAGAVVQPTGIYRGRLLSLGIIEEIKDDEPTDERALKGGRTAKPENDRMIRLPETNESRPILHMRKRG